MSSSRATAATLANAASLVSPRHGPLVDLSCARFRLGGLTMHAYRADLERLSLHNSRLTARRRAAPDQWNQEPFIQGHLGYAVSTDPEDACVRAIGEAAERYAAGRPPPPGLRTAPRDALPSAEDPAVLAPYTAAEVAKMPGLSACRKGATLRWVQLRNVRDGTQRWFPAQAIWQWARTAPGEPRILPGSSTGWAAHRSLEACLTKGLDEVAERDAFMLMWATRTVCPQVDLDSVDAPEVARIRTALQELGASFHVVDTTTDLGYPAFCAFVVNRHPTFPAMSVGLGASLDPAAGVARAANEAFAVYAAYVDMLRALFAARDAAALPGVSPNALQCLFPTAHRQFGWMWSGPLRPLRRPRPSGAGSYSERAARALERHGHSAWFLDATPAELKPLGLVVAKTVVPGSLDLGPAAGVVGRRSGRLAGRRHINTGRHPVW